MLTTEQQKVSASEQAAIIKPLKFWQHWVAAGDAFRALEKSDPIFVNELLGKGFRFLYRFLLWPLYGWLFNDGYGLWANGELAGHIYLQYKHRTATHIEVLVVNEGHRSQIHAIRFLRFAQYKALAKGHLYLTGWVTIGNKRMARAMQRRSLTFFYQFYELESLS